MRPVATLGVEPMMRVALARTSGAQPAKLSIGVVGTIGDEVSAVGDEGVTLVELLAHVGDALSAYQDKVADEAYLDADWHEGSRTLRIRLRPDLRPALCLIGDDRHLYVVAVGRDADQATVSFGDGVAGERPAIGSQTITASYERGGGGAGNLALSGLQLEKPFVVMVTGGCRASARRFC
jgi:hypothetical protein